MKQEFPAICQVDDNNGNEIYKVNVNVISASLKDVSMSLYFLFNECNFFTSKLRRLKFKRNEFFRTSHPRPTIYWCGVCSGAQFTCYFQLNVLVRKEIYGVFILKLYFWGFAKRTSEFFNTSTPKTIMPPKPRCSDSIVLLIRRQLHLTCSIVRYQTILTRRCKYGHMLSEDNKVCEQWKKYFDELLNLSESGQAWVNEC